jgi:hypothetical protein
MRIGKPSKRSRSSTRAGNVLVRGVKVLPKYISTETVIGQVSPDLIETVFAPKMIQLASESLERYAEGILLYNDALQEMKSTNQSEEAEVAIDGTISTSMDDLIPPQIPFYESQLRIDELNDLLSETSDHFMSKGYKVHVKAAKFERLLDEKYGVFRPFIKDHPEIEQFIRSLQRKYVSGYFHPLRQSSPPIPRSTSVILLFMLYRGKVPLNIVLLAALFLLVGLQPWALVAIILIGQGVVYRRKHRVVGTMKRKIHTVTPHYSECANNEAAKRSLLRFPVGSPLKENETIDCTNYDVIMIGHGPSTLYTASLLSRAGRKVLILSSESDASGCLKFQSISTSVGSDLKINNELKEQISNLEFDVDYNNIPKISRQQELMAPALATATDCQGGIRFAKIGSNGDDYAFEILSVPGMGCHDSESFDSGNGDVPFILKGSGTLRSLMDDAAEYLGDQHPVLDSNESSTGRYVTACETINAKAAYFYLSKVLPETSNKFRGSSPYGDSTLHKTAEFLNRNFALNPHLRSLMAAIGMKVENISPSGTCLAAHVTNICNSINEEGMHYPVGGPRALCHAFANIIEKHGGRIITSAPIAELVFDQSIPVKKKSKRDKEPSAPFCVGVKLRTGTEIRFGVERYKQPPPFCPVVVSMEGFIQTFIRHLPDDIRTQFKVPRGVPALSERRPVVHILFAIKGIAADLNVTGADYYRIPGAALAHDRYDQSTGEVQYGDIGWVDEDQTVIDEPAETKGKNADTLGPDNIDTTTAVRRKKKKHVKYEAGQSWVRISFPSAKDPSFVSRHGNITTCVVTIEADDDFVQQYDTKPKIFMRKKPTASSPGDIQRLCDRVKRDLFDIYPQLTGTLLRILYNLLPILVHYSSSLTISYCFL